MVKKASKPSLESIGNRVVKLRQLLWECPIKEADTFELQAMCTLLEELISDARAFQQKAGREIMRRKLKKSRQPLLFDFEEF